MSSLREKVIFDTNKIRNTDLNTFLGGRDELVRFTKVSDIILPSIVLEELRSQKLKHLKSKQNNFISNPFHWLMGLKKDDIKNFDSKSYLNSIEDDEEIVYSVIEITDYSVLEKIKDLAIRKHPPFEDKDNTDKGFKDAYIYFTILEYLDSISDKHIFVCTDDGLLKEALSKHHRIRVINGFDEFSQESIASFYDDYFIEKLNQEFTPFEYIKRDDLKDFWFSVRENHILLVEIDDQLYVIEVDSGEIIDSKIENGYRDLISRLINSPDWSNTHSVIKVLRDYVSYLSPTDADQIIQALFDNDQINGTFHHGVRSFYWELFDLAKDILPEKMKIKMSEILEKTNYQDKEFEI